MKSKKILIATVAGATATLLTLSGCSGVGSEEISDTAPKTLEGTVSLWHHYSNREAEVVQSIADDFMEANPKVKVEVHSGQEDTKITQVVATSSKVDVMITNVNTTLGTLCKSMADLEPYMERDGVSESDFQGIFASATAFEGRRCSLPTTSDVYGLYFNEDLLAEAGFSEPPETLDELEEMALEMTTYSADGSIETLGFNPLIGFQQNTAATLGASAGGDWMKDGKSVISSSPEWADLISWQKDFVDEIGYDKLKTFSSSVGDEFSANNAFQKGRIAMALDGEWRVAFIEDEAADLNYETAPFPTLKGSGQEFGGGYASAADIGVSNRSEHKELAWALAKYIATNTDAAVTLANGLKNIPTLKSAAESPDLEAPEQYKTFIEMSKSDASQTSPVTAIGATLNQTFDSFWNSYQSGSGKGLEKGLKQVDEDINNALELRGAK